EQRGAESKIRPAISQEEALSLIRSQQYWLDEVATSGNDRGRRCMERNRDPSLRSGFQKKKMVEAVGVEPTSENVTGQEPTYLVQFTRREFPRQIRVLRLERTRNANR